MKKKLLILLSAILILFTSCDLTYQKAPKSKIYLIACGVGFNGTGNALRNPLSDTEAMVQQFQELCEAGGNEYEIVWYTDDRDINHASTIDPRRFTFRHIDNGKEPTVTALYDSPTTLTLTSAQFNNMFFERIDEILTTKPTENDLLIFYFSGHGDSSINKDSEGGPYLYYGSGKNIVSLSYDKIFSKLDRYEGRQFCIFDCCYSGASIDNPGHFHNKYDHELGTMNSFNEGYTYDSYYDTISRTDTKAPDSIFNFVASSFEHTISPSGQGIPKRICLNASSYGQVAMDSDTGREVNITEYGGMTYRLLKYLGYDMVSRKAAPPNMKKKTITASDLYKTVYDNISDSLKKTSTPNITRSSYDMLLWDLR